MRGFLFFFTFIFSVSCFSFENNHFETVISPRAMATLEKTFFTIWSELQNANSIHENNLKQNSSGNYWIYEYSAIAKTLNGKMKANPLQQLRLERLLDSLRVAVPNKELASLLQIHAIPITDRNAMATGCNIFVYNGYYQNLNDSELRAVIAHEMGHILNGDSIKRFAAATRTVAIYSGNIAADGFRWLWNKKQSKLLTETFNKGYSGKLKEILNKESRARELRADATGVMLLNQAGFSGQDMIAELHKINKMQLHFSTRPSLQTSNHPSFTERLQVVRQYMKF